MGTSTLSVLAIAWCGWVSVPALAEPPRASGYAPRVPRPLNAPPIPVVATPNLPQVIAGDSLFSACYVEAAGKTFFAYLDGSHEETHAWIAVGFYDHKTATVPRPVLLETAAKPPDLAAVSLAVDSNGLLWICAGTWEHGSQLFKATRPLDMETLTADAPLPLNEAVVQAIPRQGLIALGLAPSPTESTLSFVTLRATAQRSEVRPLAAIDARQTFIARSFQGKLAVAVASCLRGEAPQQASDLYYLETSDFGQTWRSIQGGAIPVPLRAGGGAARAGEYRSVRHTVDLKDIAFDSRGNPTVLYLVGRPARGNTRSYLWTTSRWVGREWETTGIIPATSFADTGILISGPGTAWRLLTGRNGPLFARDPSVFVAWSSDDQGRSWYKLSSGEDADRGWQAVCRPVQAQQNVDAFWITAGGAQTAMRILDRSGRTSVLPRQMTHADEPVVTTAQTSRPASQRH